MNRKERRAKAARTRLPAIRSCACCVADGRGERTHVQSLRDLHASSDAVMPVGPADLEMTSNG